MMDGGVGWVVELLSRSKIVSSTDTVEGDGRNLALGRSTHPHIEGDVCVLV